MLQQNKQRTPPTVFIWEALSQQSLQELNSQKSMDLLSACDLRLDFSPNKLRNVNIATMTNLVSFSENHVLINLISIISLIRFVQYSEQHLQFVVYIFSYGFVKTWNSGTKKSAVDTIIVACVVEDSGSFDFDRLARALSEVVELIFFTLSCVCVAESSQFETRHRGLLQTIDSYFVLFFPFFPTSLR